MIFLLLNEGVLSCFHSVVGGYYFVWGESVFPGALADGGPTHHPLPEGGGGSEGIYDKVVGWVAV